MAQNRVGSILFGNIFSLMYDENENVEAGSETSGDQAESSQEQTADTAAETTEKSEDTAQDAGAAAEPKAGDPCTTPDGRPGTLHDQEGTLVCLVNQG
jgi:hypothetical protein